MLRGGALCSYWRIVVFRKFLGNSKRGFALLFFLVFAGQAHCLSTLGTCRKKGESCRSLSSVAQPRGNAECPWHMLSLAQTVQESACKRSKENTGLNPSSEPCHWPRRDDHFVFRFVLGLSLVAHCLGLWGVGTTHPITCLVVLLRGILHTISLAHVKFVHFRVPYPVLPAFNIPSSDYSHSMEWFTESNFPYHMTFMRVPSSPRVRPLAPPSPDFDESRSAGVEDVGREVGRAGGS